MNWQPTDELFSLVLRGELPITPTGERSGTIHYNCVHFEAVTHEGEKRLKLTLLENKNPLLYIFLPLEPILEGGSVTLTEGLSGDLAFCLSGGED